MSTARHAMTRRAGGRFTTRAAILAVIVGGLLLATVPVVTKFFSMRAETSSLQHQVSVLERENEQLATKVKHYKDPAYIEQMARECLGMVKHGEVAFTMVPRHGTPRPPAC